jgi:LysM repeat protein
MNVFPAAAAADGGFATWYGPGFQGNVMADGAIYNMYDPTTTASNSFPFGTWLRVTNPANGLSVVVQVRDRGAFSQAFDLSYAAFKDIADPALMEIPVDYMIVSGPSGAPVAAARTRGAPASRGGRPAPATQYLVQPGDTLSGIASQYEIDPATLAQWNGISDPNVLTPGLTLRLTAPAAAAPAPAAAPGAHYVVQPGDSVFLLSRRFGVSADQLATANGLTDPNSITIGQTIVIPSAGPAASPAPTYVVRPGDTLSGIATTFGVSVDSLQRANGITDPLTIQPGTKLTIPAG